ncbi:hypothetical protein N9291_01455, partial [bacterium]|nr:hypothetical protein [bacterium]
MRSLILIITVAASYFFLRGHPVSWDPILRICMSGVTLVLGLAIWGSAEKLSSQEAAPHRKPGWLDYFSIGAALFSLEAAFLLFFATAPDKLNEFAKDLDVRLHPESYPNLAAQDEPAPSESDLKQTSGNWLWKNNGQRSLGSRGKVRPSSRPE